MSLPDHFLAMANLVANRSNDLTTHVGCVIVGPDGDVRATGCNGTPKGVNPLPERLERPAKYLWTAHAEANALANAAKVGVPMAGCTAFVTHFPCSACSRSLIQSGIREVYVGPGTTSMPAEEFAAARTMFMEAGVMVWDQK